jgi:hypothetical protein
MLVGVGAVASVATEPAAPGTAASEAESIAELRSQLDQTAFRLAILEARLADDPKDPGARADIRAVSAAVALLNLRQQARTDRPFTNDLALAQALLPDGSETTGALTALSPYAAGGVPSILDLAIEYRRLRPLLESQIAASAPSKGMLQYTLAMLSLAHAQPADPSLDALAQAAVELERDRLALAISVIEGMDPSVAAIASGWMAAARVRLNLDERLDALLHQALSELAGQYG